MRDDLSSIMQRLGVNTQLESRDKVRMEIERQTQEYLAKGNVIKPCDSRGTEPPYKFSIKPLLIPKEWYSTRDAADFLGMSPRKLAGLIACKKCPEYVVERSNNSSKIYRFHRDALVKFKRSMDVGAA